MQVQTTADCLSDKNINSTVVKPYTHTHTQHYTQTESVLAEYSFSLQFVLLLDP